MMDCSSCSEFSSSCNCVVITSVHGELTGTSAHAGLVLTAAGFIHSCLAAVWHLSLLLLKGTYFYFLASPCLANCCSLIIATFGGELLLLKPPSAVEVEGETLGRYFGVVEVVENLGGRLTQAEVLQEGFFYGYYIQNC
eukprot:Gb_08146 [translate_table: standard]